MNIKTLNVSLLSISIITALFPLNAMATKLTIEQRLESVSYTHLSQFNQRLLAANKSGGLVVNDIAQLAGMSEQDHFRAFPP